MKETYFEEDMKRWEDDPMSRTEEALILLNEEICAIMEEKGISRSELARRLGKTRAYVTKILNGVPNLTIETLTRISLALGAKLEIKMTPLSESIEEEHVPMVNESGNYEMSPRETFSIKLPRYEGALVVKEEAPRNNLEGTSDEALNLAA
jgi:transcriptional regulator with XRE-family HTH domain